jgi:hypothetical protein
MQLLKQSTSATVKAGPFVDDADGKTAETGLTIAQADIRLSKNGGAFAQTNNASGATHDENGYYGIPLDATDTGTLGRLTLTVSESGALPVRHEYMVLPANVYDSLVGGSDTLEADAVAISGDSTAADNLEAAADGTGYDLGGIDVSELNGIVDDLINGGRLDLLVDAIKAKTDNLPADPAATSDVTALNDLSAAEVNAQCDAAIADASLATASALATVDAVVDAIKLVTDNLPNSGALTDLATAAALATVDSNIDDLVARLTAARAGYLDKLNVTGTLAHSDAAGTYKADVSGLATAASISALNDISAADVNAQVDSALSDYDPPTKTELDAAVSDVYQAYVHVTVDTDQDEYAALWYKNGTPVTSLTAPKIQVVKFADGSDLIAETAMTDLGSGLLKYAEDTNTLTGGEPAYAVVTATIDAATRTAKVPVGRDVSSS